MFFGIGALVPRARWEDDDPPRLRRLAYWLHWNFKVLDKPTVILTVLRVVS